MNQTVMSLFVLLGGTFVIQSYMLKKIEREEETKYLQEKAAGKIFI